MLPRGILPTHNIVSILVLLDVALKVDGAEALVGVFAVSILVLLDVALKDGRLVRQGRSEYRFNPCSLGCCSESQRVVPVFG